MRTFEEAGFIDTYRYANPDAGAYPGQTMNPAHSLLYAPSRIDYILTRGKRLRIHKSYTRNRRLHKHQGTDLDDFYPFYSDHSAVVTELFVRSNDTGSPEMPNPLPGIPVPVDEMTLTANSVRGGDAPSNVVDGNLYTLWHSRSQPDPPDPHPHSLTIDLGQNRQLTGVYYQPRLDGYHGIVTRYRIEISDDGEQFSTALTGSWDRDPFPKNIFLTDVNARYLRFVSEGGVGGFTSVAHFLPYYEPEKKS